MRIVFFGTPDFAVASLAELVENGYDVVGVVTAPDRPAGRGHKLVSSAVKTYAVSKDLPVLQPTNLKSPEFQDKLVELNPDIQIVVAFRMLPEKVWNFPRLGTYNVHASLLPNYRGAAPINWAIINGEKETGVSTFKLQHEIDTGSILGQRTVEIGNNETAGQLYTRLMDEGSSLLIESLEKIASGEVELTPQVVEPTHRSAPKIFKEDCEIDWTQSAQTVHNFVRGLNPFPGAFSFIDIDGKKDRLKIQHTSITNSPSAGSPGTIRVSGSSIFIAAADSQLEILELQLPGKRAQTASEFLTGNRQILEQVKILGK